MSLTRDDVAAVLGPVDDVLASELVATGASRQELVQAWTWMNADEAMVGEGRELPQGKVAELVDLLSAHDEQDEA